MQMTSDGGISVDKSSQSVIFIQESDIAYGKIKILHAFICLYHHKRCIVKKIIV